MKRKAIHRKFHFCKKCIGGRRPWAALATSLKDKRYNKPHNCAYCGLPVLSGFRPGNTEVVRVRYKGKGDFDHWWRILSEFDD